jgi:flagellar biosynthesis anti-sigma factor FlgM
LRIDKDVKTNLLDTPAKSAKTKSQKETTARRSVGVSDKAELSGDNRNVAELIAKVKSAPSIRQGKVDAVKKAIEDGTYDVKSKTTAKAILKSNILDEIPGQGRS